MRFVRRALVALAFVVVALVGVVALALVPAHLQIRRVAPPLPTLDELRAALATPDGPVASAWLDLFTPAGVASAAREIGKSPDPS